MKVLFICVLKKLFKFCKTFLPLPLPSYLYRQDATAKCLATQKHLVKESGDMLAISSWTGQVPRRPHLPPGARLSQLMALGSRRDPTQVVWMLAKSDQEMRWVESVDPLK